MLGFVCNVFCMYSHIRYNDPLLLCGIFVQKNLTEDTPPKTAIVCAAISAFAWIPGKYCAVASHEFLGREELSWICFVSDSLYGLYHAYGKSPCFTHQEWEDVRITLSKLTSPSFGQQKS